MNLVEPLQPSAHLPVGAGHALAVGAMVEDFEITSVIGLTRTSALYHATRLNDGAQVVIKEYLPSAIADRQANDAVSLLDPAHSLAFQRGLESFAAEALTLSQFDHPNLLRVMCVWEANGTIYRAMPRVAGQSLLALRSASSAPLSQIELQTLLDSLLAALRVLHDTGLAHGAVEPANIFVADDGHAMLMDFDAVHRAVGSDLRRPYIDAYADPSDHERMVRIDLHAVAAVLHFAVSAYWNPKNSSGRYEPLADVLSRLRDHTSALSYHPDFLGGIDAALALAPTDRPRSEAEFRALFEAKPPSDRASAAVAAPSAEPAPPEPVPAAPGASAEPPAKPARPPKRRPPEQVQSEFPLNSSESVLALLARFDKRPSDGVDDVEPFQPPTLPTLTDEAEPALPPLRENPFDTIESQDMAQHDEPVLDQPYEPPYEPLPYTPMPRLRKANRWQRIKLIAGFCSLMLALVAALGWVLFS